MRIIVLKRIFIIFFLITLFPGPVFSGEAFQVERDTYTSSAVCGKCHTHIYNRWKESLHAHSFDNPIFDASYNVAYRKTAGKAKTICLPCHAPTTRFTGDFDEKLPITGEGVTCDFCHTVKGVNLEARDSYITEIGPVKRGPLKEGKELDGKHEIAYSGLHNKSEFCAGCHEYWSSNSVPIIGTYSEWKKGPYPAKGTQCQGCHMPLVKGRIVASAANPTRLINEHNLVGGHSLLQLKKAIKLKIVDVNHGAGKMEVLVDISNSGSGHKVPTGIPTRRLVLNVELAAKDGGTLRDKIVYEKVLADMEGKELVDESDIMLGLPLQITKDNRLAPGETRREVFTFYTTAFEIKGVTAWLEYAYKPLILERAVMQIQMARDEMKLP